MSSLNEIHIKLNQYRKKYCKRQVIGGALIFLIISLSLFLFFAVLEYQLWMSSSARTIVLFLFIASLILGFILLIIKPLTEYYRSKGSTDNRNAAREISHYFPEIEDRLVNLLELGSQSKEESALIQAAIDKRARSFSKLEFSQAVDFTILKKYFIWFGAVILCFFLVSFINPAIISESPKRIANFSKEYEKESPFQFILINESLQAFAGEDFTISFQIEGEAIPDQVGLVIDGQNQNPELDETGIYSYKIERIQSDKELYINANGFRSKDYTIRTLKRPDLLAMTIEIIEPRYTGGTARTVSNTGELNVLEGSQVKWNLQTVATEKASLMTELDTSIFYRNDENTFVVEKRLMESGNYQLSLSNEYSLNKSKLIYDVNVIEDQYPKISTEYFPDSISFQYLTMAGSIVDDYGFSGLDLNYKKSGADAFNQVPLEINKNSKSQSFYATWQLDSLNLSSGDKVEVYIAVSDNDQVNGAKTSKSNTFIFQIPSEDEFDEMLSQKSDDVKDKLEDVKKDSEEISERLSEIEDRLKTEQKFDWQEKKLLEDVIKDREKLNEQLNELEAKSQELQNSTKQFKKQSEQLQEKNEKLQELIKQLMDEETQQLYEKLKELMKENAPKDQISEQLKQLQQNEQNLERDLERALELFKRLKMESALEENLQKLDTLGNQQENASEESDLQKSNELQEEINKEFEEFREKMDEVMEMNQELKRPEALDDFEYEEKQIAKELKEIQEMLDEQLGENEPQEAGENQESDENESSEPSPGEENENSGSQKQQNKQGGLKQKQQSAGQKMKSLSQKLSSMQGGMQMEMMQANLDQLRDILDNLIKLSFNQEEIMDEMRVVNQSDPRFLELSQDQLKLKDDAKVIQDSLLSLASRVVQISSFVTREVEEINQRVDETIDFLKDRNRGRALTSQQFAMTSINNLALLLDDTMQQMQMAMADAMGNGSDQQQKPQGIPNMQEMQNQLGQKIEDLKGSGKSGRELSEELARLAAEQEMIRQQMEQLKEAENGRPGGKQAGDQLQRAIDMMEQNEIDLVNKRLTEQLIFRQKEISTRLLEADKAKREQETEEEREAESPSIISREIPPEFEEYLKLKKKEIELLKTIPIELNPFYKKEVNDYFRRISSEEPE